MRLGPTATRLHFILPGGLPTAAEVEQRLSAVHDGKLSVTTRKDGGWIVRCFREDEGEIWELSPDRAPEITEFDLATSDISDEERAAVHAARYTLTIQAEIDPGSALYGFGNILRVGLLASGGGAIAVFDPEGGTVHSHAWLQDCATEGVPIRLDALYRIHAVTTDVGVWLHTHGLRRAGVPELELLACPPDCVAAAGALLRAVAHRAILHGSPDMGEVHPYGHDLACALVPWSFVHGHIRPPVGGPEDRDEQHGEDNLVLVTWEPTSERSGIWASAATQLPPLGEAPVFFLTEYKTERMEALARLRWQRFALLANHFAGAKGWRFLAKFGYGGDSDETRREHLWFEVHHAYPFGAEATLVNEPFQELGIQEGDRGSHELERLTDFRVSSPMGVHTPENIDRLLKRWMDPDDGETFH